MANKTEKAEVSVIFNTSQASKSAKELSAEIRKYRAEWRNAKTESDRALAAEKMVKAQKALERINLEVKEISKSYDRAADKAGLFNKISSGTDGLTGKLKSAAKSTGAFLGGILGVSYALQQQTKYVLELDDAYSDVMKTTGLTYQQVKLLDKQLQNINTRTSRTELLKLATEAGKLGKGTVADVKRFVEEADKINVALGEDLGQDAIIQIGKLSNIFGKGMLEIASGINAIGAASEASEGYQVDFASRLSGTAKTARIAIGDILGYGGTLESLGQSAEVSGTALSSFFIDFVKNTDAFGNAAGFAKGELTKLLKTDGTNTAFVKFLTGLKEGSKTAQEMLFKMEQLGIDGTRGANVFLTLANNLERLTTQQTIANDAVREGTSVVNEFNTRNNNAAAKAEKLGKALKEAFSRFITSDAIGKLLDFTSSLLGLEKRLSSILETERIELRKVELQLLDVNTSQKDRITLIKELQAKYPEYLSNINAETATTEDLTKALAEVNKMLINKIILQKEDEKIQDQNNNVAEARMALIKREDSLRAQIIKKAEKNNLTFKEGLTLEQQALEVLDFLDKKRGKGKSRGGILFSDAAQLSHELSQYEAAKNIVEGREKGLTKILERRNEIAQRLGLNVANANKKQEEKPDFSNLSTGQDLLSDKDKKRMEREEDKERNRKEKFNEKLAEMQAKLNEKLSELRNEDLMAKMSADERELFESQLKYEALIKMAKEYGRDLKKNEGYFSEFISQIQEQQAKERESINDKHRHREFLAELDSLAAEANAENEYNEKRKEFIKEEDRRKLNEKDQEIYDIEEKYKKLTELYQYYGLETTDLERQRQEEITKIQNEHDKARRQALIDAAGQTANTIADAAIQIGQNKRQSEFDAEMTDLDKRREAELANDLLTEEQRKKIQEKYTEEENKLKLKQWESQKKADIASANIKGALGVLTAISQGGLFAAIPATVAWLANLAVIEAQEPPQFYEGGFTKQDSSDRTVAGIVHANEYVIDAESLKNPFVFDFAKAIEAKKKGYQQGGFTTNNSNTTINNINNTSVSGSQTGENPLLEQLLFYLKHPVAPILIVDNQFVYQLDKLRVENQQALSESSAA